LRRGGHISTLRKRAPSQPKGPRPEIFKSLEKDSVVSAGQKKVVSDLVDRHIGKHKESTVDLEKAANLQKSKTDTYSIHDENPETELLAMRNRLHSKTPENAKIMNKLGAMKQSQIWQCLIRNMVVIPFNEDPAKRDLQIRLMFSVLSNSQLHFRATYRNREATLFLQELLHVFGRQYPEQVARIHKWIVKETYSTLLSARYGNRIIQQFFTVIENNAKLINEHALLFVKFAIEQKVHGDMRHFNGCCIFGNQAGQAFQKLYPMCNEKQQKAIVLATRYKYCKVFQVHTMVTRHDAGLFSLVTLIRYTKNRDSIHFLFAILLQKMDEWIIDPSACSIYDTLFAIIPTSSKEWNAFFEKAKQLAPTWLESIYTCKRINPIIHHGTTEQVTDFLHHLDRNTKEHLPFLPFGVGKHMSDACNRVGYNPLGTPKPKYADPTFS